MDQRREVFQNGICIALYVLEGVINVSDDILVWGRDVSEQDRSLHSVLTRLSSLEVTLNASKCKFCQDLIKFYRFIFARKGIQADPENIKAVISLQNQATLFEASLIWQIMFDALSQTSQK